MSHPGDQVTASPDQWRRQDPDVPTARRARPARHASPPPPGAAAPGSPAPGSYAPPVDQYPAHPSGPLPIPPLPIPPRGGFSTHPSGPLPVAPGGDFTAHPSGPFPTAPGGQFPGHPSGPFPAPPADQDPSARGRRHSRPDAGGEDGGGSTRGRSRSRSDDRSERPKRGRRKPADAAPDRSRRELGDWRETDDSDGPDFSGMFMSAPAWEDTGDPPGPAGGTGVAFAEPADDFSDLSDESLAAWTAGFADLRINAHVDKRRPSVTKPPRTSPPSTTRPPRATPPGISKPPRSRGPKAAPPKQAKRSGRTRPEPEDHGYAPPAEPQERRDGRIGRRRRPESEDQGHARPTQRDQHEPEHHGYAPPAPRRAPEPQARSFALPPRQSQPLEEPGFADALPFPDELPFSDAPPFADDLQLDTLAPPEVPELARPAESGGAALAEPGLAGPAETMITPAEHGIAPVKGGSPGRRGSLGQRSTAPDKSTEPDKPGATATAASRTRAAKAAARKASRRKGNRWVLAGAGLSVIAILAAVVYLVYPSGTPQPAAISHPSSFSAAQAATNPTPSAAPSGWQHIASRTDDSAPLTLTQLFPAQFTVSGASYTRTIEQGTSDCAKAVFGVGLQAVVHTYSCNQVMRATYLSSSQNVMGTIGVLNLATSSGATKVGKATGANGFISQLVGPSGPTHSLDKGTGLAEAEVKGHYLILTWVEFANLKTPKSAAQKTQLRTFSANLIDQTANVSLTNRMVTGEP